MAGGFGEQMMSKAGFPAKSGGRAMRDKNKGRAPTKDTALKNENYSPDCTGDDPLLGWHSLGKRARFERQAKRGWNRGGRDNGR